MIVILALGILIDGRFTQCHLHTSQYAPLGWYEKSEKTLTLDRPILWR
jgi:hypothetical protein